ncbi:uncharacterized protein [Nicotiana tomentosiformis]|uniref:uncharacterized protein n=1 Tax=Nicotiana tomentosiformis TaxID=4098 RepID=UPI00388C4326
MPKSSYRPPAHQDSSSAYFSAMPKSSYRSLAIHGSSSGYLGHQGQTLEQQSMVPRGCYESRDPGHMKRICPRLQGKAVHQGHHPMIAAPAIRPPRGGRQEGRGQPRGRGQEWGGQPAIVQSGGGQPTRTPTRFYAFPARPDVVASDAVITCIISIYGRDALVLFDPESTCSYVSSLFAHFLDIPRESLGTPIYVSTLVGNSAFVDWIYRSCVVAFCGYETRADLLLLDMTNFEVISGMEWLSLYHAILDCHAKTVTLVMPELHRLEWKGLSVSTSSRVISFLGSKYGRDRDIILRQHRWLELLKDYDITILYHPGKANVVVDALSRKAESMGSLAIISADERPLALDIQSLANRLVRETVLHDVAKEVSIGEDGVLRLQGRLCVPNVNGLRESILEEAHSSRYSIYPGATKMYRDLRQHYSWRGMKKDIVEYVSRCLNCQQIKYEHQRPGGLLQ